MWFICGEDTSLTEASVSFFVINGLHAKNLIKLITKWSLIVTWKEQSLNYGLNEKRQKGKENLIIL